MAIKAGTFDSLTPSQYISFTIPVVSLSCPTNYYFYTKDLQISVLDSPILLIDDDPRVAAMLVPKNREKDWIFSTKAGHIQLLLSCPGISRLILIGNAPNCDDHDMKMYTRVVENDPVCREMLERSLCPLLMALLPKEVAQVGKFDVPFFSYEDNVVNSVVVERCVGPCVGEMLVEDVEIEGFPREFRRRLRFKRLPNLVQTEIRIVPLDGIDNDKGYVCVGEVEFCPDLGVLVHPYLAPMVAGLSLISGFLQERFASGVRPRGLCVGVGGGALLSFLCKQLDFEVVGVEVDEVVLRVAKKYFALENGGSIQLLVGDGIELLKQTGFHDKGRRLSSLDLDNKRSDCHANKYGVGQSIFDVVMVDLDSSDPKMGVSAPDLEFVQKDVLSAAKSSLSEHGVLVLNVIPPNRSFYDMLILELRGVFVDLHEIDCGNEENFVLIASMSSVGVNSGSSDNAFLRKLKSVISGVFIDSIRQI